MRRLLTIYASGICAGFMLLGVAISVGWYALPSSGGGSYRRGGRGGAVVSSGHSIGSRFASLFAASGGQPEKDVDAVVRARVRALRMNQRVQPHQEPRLHLANNYVVCWQATA